MKNPRRPLTLEDKFELEEMYLSTPDTAALKSALIRARDLSSDEQVAIKYWKKTGSSIDADLRDLWRHEMRQLERIRAFPGADEVIVQFPDFGETADAFYMAGPGEFAPLDFTLRYAKSDHWLKNLRLPQRRLILWSNLRRIATALGALQGQGVVHGRIDRHAIFTSGASHADFRLGGLEWCLRLAEPSSTPLAVIAASKGEPVIYSFRKDWRDIGALAIELLDLDPSYIREGGWGETVPAVDLRASELDLLRSLIQPERNRALSAEAVTGAIDSVTADLRAEAIADHSRHVLVLRLGDTSKLSAILRTVAADSFEASDHDAQLAFVTADIYAGAQLCRTGRGELFILTESLAYTLQPLRRIGEDETWRVASCDRAILRADAQFGRAQTVPLVPHKVEVIRYGAASRRLQELRTDALEWSITAEDREGAADGAALLQRGFLLAQVAEGLFRAAEIIPVEVVEEARESGKSIVRVRAREVDDRARLNAALGVEGPLQLLARLFEREEADIDAEWQLSESGALGGGRGRSIVRFQGVVSRDDHRLYEFEVGSVVPPSRQLFLRKSEEAGTQEALRRRLRMLGVLATHQELCATLVDPRTRLRTYPAELVEDDAFGRLDASKQAALRSIWTTGPLQVVVGPPGVGKTRLVADLVRRIVLTDPAARILLSAQAHQALDHLAMSVQKALHGSATEDVLLVRSRSASAAATISLQTREKAVEYLGALERSALYQGAPLQIRRSITEMRTADGRPRTSGNGRDERGRRAFETLVLESASVLFSTTNSGDLGRLVEERAQFDWVIIEEAAKATGPELLAPQLLSMRRLLIGDHNQLPPFDTERIITFLSNQTNVRNAIADSDAVIGSVFRDFGLDDLRETLEEDASLGSACEVARQSVSDISASETDLLS